MISLSSCGDFRPVYSDQRIGFCRLKGIIIESGDNDASRIITKILNDYLSACENNFIEEKLKLVIDVDERKEDILFLKTGEATRKSINITINFGIYDMQNNLLYSGKVNNSDAYNSIDSPFNEYVADRNAKNYAAIGITRKIFIQLIHFLNQYENTSNSGR